MSTSYITKRCWLLRESCCMLQQLRSTAQATANQRQAPARPQPIRDMLMMSPEYSARTAFTHK